jgi:hypothetical protein
MRIRLVSKSGFTGAAAASPLASVGIRKSRFKSHPLKRLGECLTGPVLELFRGTVVVSPSVIYLQDGDFGLVTGDARL